MDLALRRVLTVIGLTVLWILLVGQWSVAELVAGVVAAILATTTGALSGASKHSRLRMRWLSRSPGPVLQVFSDTIRVVAAIGRGLFGRAPEGRFLEVADPDSSTRLRDERLSAHVLGISLTPNTVVADVPNAERGYLVHQLVEASPPELEALP